MNQTSSPLKTTNPVLRLFAQQMSPTPADGDALAIDGETLTLALDRLPEIAPKGGAVRLDDERLPDRLLVVHGIDDEYYCYANHCACGGFRIDPVPGEEKIRCCTLMKATYTYAGEGLSEHIDKGLTVYALTRTDDSLAIDLGSAKVMAKVKATE